MVAVPCGTFLRFGRQEPCAGHRLPCLRGACCSAGRKLPRGKVSRTCCRMGYREERSSIADAGRPGNGEKGLVALSQGTQLPCRHLIPRGWWNRLPILRRAKGHTGRKRPRYPIPAACRPMGPTEKRRSDAGAGDCRLQPPRVVALRKGTFLSGCYSSPRAEWKRLSVLLQPQGSAWLQRPRDDRAGRCLAMAPDAQRQPYTAAGDAPAAAAKVWWLCDKGHAWRAVCQPAARENSAAAVRSAPGRPLSQCTAIVNEAPAK